MPYIYMLFASLLFHTICFSQELVISGQKVNVEKKLNPNDSGEEIEIIEISVENKLYMHREPLVHVLKEHYGDCNSESVQVGTYTFTDTSLVLYSYWCRAGDAPVSPYGVRKQVYKIDKNQGLVWASGVVYVEAGREEWIGGMKYLNKTPLNKKEKEQREKYIAQIEEEYIAEFVQGEEAEKLLREVKKKLSKEIREETKGWAKREWMYPPKM